MTLRAQSAKPLVDLRTWAIASVVALSLTACASGTDSEPTSTAVAGEPTSAPVEEAPETSDEAPETSTDVVGAAVLRVDGEEFPDFAGECDISNGYGTDDVQSVDDPELKVQVAIDNTAAHPERQMNFIVYSREAASFRALDAVGEVPAGEYQGAVDSIAELSDRTPYQNTSETALLRFSGALDNGTPFELDVVCVIQNAY